MRKNIYAMLWASSFSLLGDNGPIPMLLAVSPSQQREGKYRESGY